MIYEIKSYFIQCDACRILSCAVPLPEGEVYTKTLQQKWIWRKDGTFLCDSCKKIPIKGE